MTTVKLSQPLMVDGKAVDEVTVRRPKVRDLRAMEQTIKPGDGERDQLDEAVGMIAFFCGLPREAVDDMDATDFAVISETIAGFFPAGILARAGGSL